jgi:DHA1 family tetracycline resistance protein-like MFS transporter
MTVSQAYISDVTEPKDRTKIFGYQSAVFGAGLIFGPLIGGILSDFGYSIPMLFAALMSLVSIILVIIFLKESLADKKDKFSIKFNEIIPVNEVKRFFKAKSVRGLLLTFFIYNFAFMIFISSFALYANIRIGITSQEIGFYMAWVGILRILFQTVLIAPLLKRVRDKIILRIGILALIITMISLIFITNLWFVYIPLIFLSFGTGVTRPILMSKLTNSVSREETGSLLGVNNSFGSVAQILSPILGGLVLEYLPSQILPSLSAFFFSLIFITWRGGLVKKVQEEKAETIEI